MHASWIATYEATLASGNTYIFKIFVSNIIITHMSNISVYLTPFLFLLGFEMLWIPEEYNRH